MDRLTVRKPTTADLGETLKDMITLRAAPPMLVSAAAIVLLTGNFLFGVLTVGITSFTHSLWARLAREENGEA